MRKLRVALISGMISVIFLLCTTSVFAIDYVLGARAGFFFWRPFYKDMPSGTGLDDIRTGHGGLYGPILAVNFTEQITLSVSGLFGQQTTQWHTWDGYNVSNEGTQYQYSRTSYVEANRYDVDSALSYALIRGLHIFIGYKFQYMGMDWYSTERIYLITDNRTEIRNDKFEFKVPFNGFALGIGYSANLSNLYYFTISLSGIYARGQFKVYQISTEYNDTGFVPSTPTEPNPRDESQNIKIHEYGINIEPSVGIRTPGPLVTLGIRYQLLRNQFYNLDSSGGDGPDDRWMNDHLYGIFVSVMYVL